MPGDPTSTRDVARQAANAVLAPAITATTVLLFPPGTDFDPATAAGVPDPPVVPAGYAFLIWTVIYAGAVAYGVFQALPGQRSNPLFRAVGWSTASAFLGTIAWLVMARLGGPWTQWGTVACILWMAASLAGAVREFGRPVTAAERWLAVVPLSVFAGWVTVAVVANTAAALKVAGLLDVGLPERGWAVVMLAAAGLVAGWATARTGGNPAYALTVVWGLVGVVVANLDRGPDPVVAGVAGLAAAGVLVTLVVARRGPRAELAPG